MIQIIAGRNGKGKTKHLLSQAAEAVQDAHGTIVYLDKSLKHMFELDRRIRLINVREYPLRSLDGFLGFLCGMISQDHDLEVVFMDCFELLACVNTPEEIEEAVRGMAELNKLTDARFVISVSRDKEELPEAIRDQVVLSL